MIQERTSRIAALRTGTRLGHYVCVLELVVLEVRCGARGSRAGVERHLVVLIQVDTLDDIDLTLFWPVVTYRPECRPDLRLAMHE